MFETLSSLTAAEVDAKKHLVMGIHSTHLASICLNFSDKRSRLLLQNARSSSACSRRTPGPSISLFKVSVRTSGREASPHAFIRPTSWTQCMVKRWSYQGSAAVKEPLRRAGVPHLHRRISIHRQSPRWRRGVFLLGRDKAQQIINSKEMPGY